MKKSRSDAIAICESLGFGTASRWDKSKMQKKMAEIQVMGIDLEVDPEGFDSDKEYNRICDLLEEVINISESIEVISDTKYKEISDNLVGDSDGNGEEDSEVEEVDEGLVAEEGSNLAGKLSGADIHDTVGVEEKEVEQEEEEREDIVEDEEKTKSPQEEIIEPKEEFDLVAMADIANKADDKDEEAIKYLAELAAKKNITPSKYTTWMKVAKAISTGVIEESNENTYRARKYELRRKTIKVPERPRNTKSRTFIAGQVLRDYNMGEITVEMTEEVMKRYGDGNYRASRNALTTSWNIVAGYLGKDLIED